MKVPFLVPVTLCVLMITAMFASFAVAESGNQTIYAEQQLTKTYTDLYKGKQVNWSWSVDRLDLNFWIEDPAKAKFYQVSAKSSDSGSFTVPTAGNWTFVWSNTYVATASENYAIKVTYNIDFKNKAPTASIAANVTSGYAPLSVNFTGSGLDTDGVINSYFWNFGDLTTSTTRNPVHLFTLPGDYNVSLTVTDNEGATGKKNVTIHVSERPNSPPTASISADVTTGYAPLKVTFKGSGFDTDGNIVSYDWSFGDGDISNLKNPVHTFQAPGSYTVVLLVTDDDGANASATADILVDPVPNVPPTAKILVDLNSGIAPLKVTFTGQGTDTDGKIVKWNWSFGDGKYSNTQNTTHTFAAPNKYTVTLKVTDDDDATGEKTIDITVTQRINKAPMVTATADRTSGRAPLAVSFASEAADPDGIIAALTWDFDDGATSQERNATHTFISPGIYEVTVKVRDNDNAEASAKVTITVEAVPPDEVDTDKDGMPDQWETDNGLDPEDPTDPSKDSDGDGLTNLQEFLNGTQADTADTDSDGMPDGWEVELGFDPTDPEDALEDSDEDGATNLDEYKKGTDPNDPKSVPKKVADDNNGSWIWYLLAALAILALLIIVVVVVIAVTKGKKKEDRLPEPAAQQPQPLPPEPTVQQAQPMYPPQPQYGPPPSDAPMQQGYGQPQAPPPQQAPSFQPPQQQQAYLPPPPPQQPVQDPYSAPINK